MEPDGPTERLAENEGIFRYCAPGYRIEGPRGEPPPAGEQCMACGEQCMACGDKVNSLWHIQNTLACV